MRKDDLSSTEKLLQQIRGRRSDSGSDRHSVEPPTAATATSRYGRLLPLKKPVQIGVDIGYAELRLIKTRPLSPPRHQILDYRCVPFEKGLEPASLLFPRFLRNVLTQFCDAPPDSTSIWAAVSSAQLDIRYLQIPKVPKRRLANAVYWAYKRKNPLDEKQKLFDFELLGDAADGDAPRYEIIGYSLPLETVQNLQGLFTRAGFKLTGVSTYPFLMQQLLRTRWKILAQGNLCALYVGRTWSRIDIYRDSNLIMSRGIRAGMASMQAAIEGSPQVAGEVPIETAAPIDFSSAEGAAKELVVGSESLAADLMAQLIPVGGPASDSLVRPHDPGNLFEMALPAVDRLVRQVERTIGHYALNYGHPDIDRLYISGQVCANALITDYIADQLGLPQSHLDPFEGETNVKAPQTPYEQSAYAPALGLATAREEDTPNFLMPFPARLKRERHQILNGCLFAVFLALMVALMGFSAWQKHGINLKKLELERLQLELNGFVPLVNRETVVILAAKAREGSQQLAQIGTQYRGLATVGELTELTPSAISLVDLKVNMPRIAPNAESAPRQLVSMSGIVRGSRLDLEPTLAAYMIHLKQSPLLANPQITHKAFEMHGNQEVLRFAAELELR